MVKLIAISRADGWYYFTEDDENVQVIKPPFNVNRVNQVANIKLFYRLTAEQNFEETEREFHDIKELVEFAANDKVNDDSFSKRTSYEYYIDFLQYAPIEIVEMNMALIEELLKHDTLSSREIKGVGQMLTQLDKNAIVSINESIRAQLSKMKLDLDMIRFPFIPDMTSVDRSTQRVKHEGHFFVKAA